MRAGGQRIGQIVAGLKGCGTCGAAGVLPLAALINLARHQHVRRQIDAAIGDGGNHRDQLQRRDGDLLADGDRADGRRPATCSPAAAGRAFRRAAPRRSARRSRSRECIDRSLSGPIFSASLTAATSLECSSASCTGITPKCSPLSS